ncbi:MAG: molybdopterin-dependent oxidoreductase, partial [Deltaproteobacteria bacterium]|nr:molybdopterin-dependent oxidoreductase [Deltaproteobacteria bacterium]
SPVNYNYGYGQMRQGEGRNVRGKLVQIEPRLSLTGANADEWVPVRPGTEGVLALGIAYIILEGGYYRGGDAKLWKDALKKYNPEAVASTTEVSEDRIKQLGKEFATTKPSLAIGGETVSSYENGVSNLVAINLLNHLSGNIGKTGGVIPNPDVIKKSFNPIATIAKDASRRKIKTLILHNANPVFTTPETLKLKDALKDIPFIASLSSLHDETTALADLILPSHTYFEDWGDDFAEPTVGYSVATIMQPAVSPLFNTKGAGDVFISLAKTLGGNLQKDITWEDFGVFLRDSWKKIYERHKGDIKEANFEDFWNDLLARGGWWDAVPKASKPVRVAASEVSAHLSSEPAKFEGNDKEYPFYLILYPHLSYKDGRGANLPWLQELPDPMTSVVWGTWIEMNSKAATGMGIKEGDMLLVESPFGKITAPVYFYPGQRPDTISIPLGQGHTSYGRYADGRGANPIELLPAKTDPKTGAIPLNSTRIKITRVNAPKSFVKMEGVAKELGRNIVQTITPEEFKKMGKEA